MTRHLFFAIALIGTGCSSTHRQQRGNGNVRIKMQLPGQVYRQGGRSRRLSGHQSSNARPAVDRMLHTALP